MNYKQDLFYGNIPYSKGRKIEKLGYLKRYLKEKSFIGELKNPYFIWTGTGKISSLETMVLDEKTKNCLKKNNLDIYFFLYEPLCARIGKYNRSFYSEFTADLDLSLVVSDELNSIKIFIENNEIENFCVFTSDYNIQLIQKNYPELRLNCLDLFLREIANDCYKKNIRVEREESIEKKFWCGNWRYTPHRHLVAAYLVNINSGIYSWNLKCSFEDLKKNIWFDLDQYEKTDRKRFKLIKNGVDILNNRVFSIDTDIEQVEVDNYAGVYIPGYNLPRHSENFLDSYKKCFCAVVNETRFAQPFGYFSEKTFTAIHSKLPFIIVAPPFSLEYLKRFGFKTFDRWWDESYDNETDHYRRIIKIFDIIDEINCKSIKELRQIYKNMTAVLDHNLKILKTIPMHDVPF